jgi:hypothetical protein
MADAIQLEEKTEQERRKTPDDVARPPQRSAQEREMPQSAQCWMHVASSGSSRPMQARGLRREIGEDHSCNLEREIKDRKQIAKANDRQQTG